MNYLFPPDFLAASGFVFRTNSETSAFSDLLAKELFRRLNKGERKVENISDIEKLYCTDADWKAFFLKTANELMEELEINRSKIRGLVNMKNSDLHTISIQQLYLSRACEKLLVQKGLQSIGDIQDACNNLSLKLPHKYLIEVLGTIEKIAPTFLN